MANELIVTFTHTNYCLHSAGTEKFAREYSELLQGEGYTNLAFFAIEPRLGNTPKYTGVILDDFFMGIYNYARIGDIILYVADKRKLKINSFCIQHLKNHDVDMINRLIRKLGIKVNIFIHDFFSLCINHRMIDSNGETCGHTPPDDKKCADCKFRKEGKKHYELMSVFFKSIYDDIHRIMVPSEFVFEIMKKNYPFLEDRLYVRPHLKFKGSRELNPVKHKKLHIAYIGAQIKDKGFSEWEKLSSCVRNCQLFYFGFGDIKTEGVQNIYVSGTSNGKRMEDFLREKEIDCALLWSHCGETYSYVYYEMATAGVFVMTNTTGGNITQEVKNKKNGKIFDSIEDCIDWINSGETAVCEINEYRANPLFAPLAYMVNDELCLPDDGIEIQYNDNVKIKKKKIISSLYTLKHRLSDKGEIKLKIGSADI